MDFEEIKNLTKDQMRALQGLTNTVGKRSPEMTYIFQVSPTEYGTCWLTIDGDRNDCAPDTLLYLISNERFFIHIGKRGGLTVHSCPKSMEQFRGKYAYVGSCRAYFKPDMSKRALKALKERVKARKEAKELENATQN